MYTTPVQGTNLVVAATTYIDEFSRPARNIIGTMEEDGGFVCGTI
jgi:hypothetical protein